MPHIPTGQCKPIHERSGRELILVFVIVPIILAGLFMGVTGWMIYQHRDEFSTGDWFGAAWVFLFCPLMMIALPCVAWQEWERRKQFGKRKQKP